MKDLLKDLLTYGCRYFNCPKDFEFKAILVLTIVLILFFALSYSLKLIKSFIRKKNQKRLNKNLSPDYSPYDIDNYLSYYIPQYYQNLSPSLEEEPSPKHASVARERIIDLFLKKIFVGKTKNKYFIILAGSGMGKTSFLINLYLKYKNKPQNALGSIKYKIQIVPLGSANAIKKIQGIEEKSRTILLLDAFDEDTEALKDYEKRMSQILTECRLFPFILITCRTQFFSSEAEEPYTTGQYSFGEQGQYYFQKLYLSYFNQKDINKYLRKRFGIFNKVTIKKAKKIINKSPNLFVRPMLLGHVEELLKVRKSENLTSKDIYRILIGKWIEREANKPGLLQKYKSISFYKDLLFEFSTKLAYKMYIDRNITKGFFIPHNSKFEIEFTEQKSYDNDLVGKENYSMREFELKDFDIDKPKKIKFGIKQLDEEFLNKNYRSIKSRSLLNRDNNGNYKFSHKTILEYFLAINIIEDNQKAKTFDFDGFEMVREFVLQNYGYNEAGSANTHRLPKLISEHVLRPALYKDISVKILMRHKSYKLITNSEYTYDIFPDNIYILPNIQCYIIIDFTFDFIYRISYEYKINRLDDESLESFFELSYNNRRKIIDYLKNSKINDAVTTFATNDRINKERLFQENHLYTNIYFDKFVAYLIKLENIEKEFPSKTFYY